MDTMLKINHIKVIIIGLRGLGVEISKNIILTRVNEIAIFDDNIYISSSFYISKKDVNEKRRDDACY